MKMIHSFLGLLCAFCMMFILLITSVEAVTYWTPGYYEKEYAKYNVTEDVNMKMDDLLDVTHEMMAYLRGNRDNLHVPTVVGGQVREFFNAREIAHMEDVRGLHRSVFRSDCSFDHNYIHRLYKIFYSFPQNIL